MTFLAFQPVSFTGRDEQITDERRKAQRYTLSHLAYDVKAQVGLGEPARDWFPISFISTFSDWADFVHGPRYDWGSLLLRLPSQLRRGYGADAELGDPSSLENFLQVITRWQYTGSEIAKSFGSAFNDFLAKFLPTGYASLWAGLFFSLSARICS